MSNITRREPSRRPNKQEKLLESPSYKLQRLKDLTRQDDEVLLTEIYSELVKLIDEMGIEMKGDVLIFKSLDGDDQQRVDEVLGRLGIQAFPDPETAGSSEKRSNKFDLYVENKWAKEILRLMSVLDFAESKLERIKSQREYEKRQSEQKVEREKRQAEFEADVKLAMTEAVESLLLIAQAENRRIKEDEIEYTKRKAEIELRERFDIEKKLFQESETLKREELKRRADEYLMQIPKQELTSEEIEIELRRISPIDELWGYGNMGNVLKQNGRGRYTKGEFKYDEENAEPDLTQTFSEYTENWLAGKLAQIDTPQEQSIWNERLPSLKIFGKKQFLWKLEGKGKKVLRAIDSISFPELGIELKSGDVVNNKDRETLFIAAKDNQSADPARKKIGERALNLTIKINLGLIMHFIKDLKYFSPTKYANIPGDDMFTFGVIGLLTCVNNYDPNVQFPNGKRGRHVPYLASYIEGSLRNLDTRDYDFNIRQISPPQAVDTNRNKLNKVREMLRRTFPDKKVDENEVRRQLQADFEKEGVVGNGIFNVNTEEAYSNFLALVQDIYGEIDMKTFSESVNLQMHDVDLLGNSLYQESANLDRLHLEDLKRIISGVLVTLSPKEERILRLRFGIGVSEKTLEEVGDFFEVTRTRIGQIEAKALRKLKMPNRINFWKKVHKNL